MPGEIFAVPYANKKHLSESIFCSICDGAIPLKDYLKDGKWAPPDKCPLCNAPNLVEKSS